jgi:YD repeat-containing protein
VVSATDGRGQQIDYTYDILGRLVSAILAGRPASEAVTYTWDIAALSGSRGVGRLGRVVDSGTTVEYGYDHRGNVTTKRQRIGTGAWLTQSFTYDLADRRTQITYPSGRIVNYTWNTLGRVTQVRTKASSAVTAWTTLSSGHSYESFGAITGANYGNGLRMRQSWGNDGRLADRRLEVSATSVRLSSLTYQYDNSDNITGITDMLDGSKSRTFGYDPVERLTRMNGAVGSFAREDYLHDDNGNRLSVERRSTVNAAAPAETDSYSIAPGTNRLTSITSAAGTRSFTHDARGNQTGETRPDGSTVTVAYDGRARLTSYTVGSATQTMLYNGADERIRVVTTPTAGPVDTRQFVYDLDHRIVGEYGAGGAADLKADYVWLLPEVGASGPTGGDDGTGGYTPLAVAVGVAGPTGISPLAFEAKVA